MDIPGAVYWHQDDGAVVLDHIVFGQPPRRGLDAIPSDVKNPSLEDNFRIEQVEFHGLPPKVQRGKTRRSFLSGQG
jgi:hypothetical protein